MFYSIFCTLNGKEIGSISGDYADDATAIETARCYLRSIGGDKIRVHRGALYPLGEMIAEGFARGQFSEGFRQITKPLPPDPEYMNGDRASWAEAAISQFQIVSGTDWDDCVKDLLCDLMHFCDRNTFQDGETAFDFEAALGTARMHYEAETTASD